MLHTARIKFLVGLSEAKHDLDHMEMVDSDLEESFSSIGSGRHAKTYVLCLMFACVNSG